MKYFKNTELAKLYKVSEKSVRNWIESTKLGKLDFVLYEDGDKPYIANTTKNIALVEKLVERGKKFKNTRGLKTLVPSKEFYNIYNPKQIVDIISNITIHKEIPLQYGYLNGGADSWNHYARRLGHEESPNILNRTTELLNVQAPYIDKLVGMNRKVNVIDLGPGNGLPIRATLTRLLEQGRLNRYIAIDISQNMLAILEKNIQSWFGTRVKVEGYVRNFTEERFDDLFINNRSPDDTPCNMVFLLGGTLGNMRLPKHTLRVINSSLAADDLFFCSGYLDTPYMRRYFDLSGATLSKKDSHQGPGSSKLGVRLMVPSLLNIDETLCDFELAYSEDHRSRFQWMRPKVDLLINFTLGTETWPVEFRKNEPILLWRHRQYTYAELVQFLDKNDFDVLQASKSANQNYYLTISKIKLGIVSLD